VHDSIHAGHPAICLLHGQISQKTVEIKIMQFSRQGGGEWAAFNVYTNTV